MIKRIEPKDYAYVLKLNEEYVDVLIPMDRDELSFLEKRAAIFHIIYVDGAPAGFIIALREGLKEYDLDEIYISMPLIMPMKKIFVYWRLQSQLYLITKKAWLSTQRWDLLKLGNS